MTLKQVWSSSERDRKSDTKETKKKENENCDRNVSLFVSQINQCVSISPFLAASATFFIPASGRPSVW